MYDRTTTGRNHSMLIPGWIRHIPSIFIKTLVDNSLQMKQYSYPMQTGVTTVLSKLRPVVVRSYIVHGRALSICDPRLYLPEFQLDMWPIFDCYFRPL